MNVHFDYNDNYAKALTDCLPTYIDKNIPNVF